MDKKVCLVTGASGDIGKAVCEKFLKKDYFVVMIASGLKKLEQTIEDKGFDKNSVMALAIDVSSEEAVKEGIEEVKRRCGRIDTLVNTAGICGEYNLTADTEYDNFKRIYEVNVFGTFLMIKHSIPLMLETGNASIVNFGSVSGMMGYSYEVGYGSSKWAIIGMTKNVANEYGGKGIRCNSVSPGWVQSKMMDKTVDNYRKLGIEDPEAWMSYGSIRRGAKPSEVADAVYFLSSDEASFINGANLTVDGGMTII